MEEKKTRDNSGGNDDDDDDDDDNNDNSSDNSCNYLDLVGRRGLNIFYRMPACWLSESRGTLETVIIILMRSNDLGN